MADASSYCFCGKQYDPSQFMIQCDFCHQWFHGSCVNVKEYESSDIDKYSCRSCEATCGSTIYKPILNRHRYDHTDPDASNKPVQTGTPVFIEELQKRSFLSADEIILRLRGQQLTLPYLNSHGFSWPILVETKDGLDLHTPPESFNVQDVEHYVGSDRILDVIDVTRQADIRMPIAEFVEYFNNPSRTKVYNVISLEFSDTSLSALVSPPYIARKLCWANYVWPHDYPVARPDVQRYCLMGAAGSYTDFHIDFGGSSVWYHMFKGEKIFYLAEPTPKNLELYQQWLSNPNHLDVFFGDMVENCYKLVLQQGQTLFIPTGWIHSVYTPKDSLVFGGNFLHSLNVELQLKVYEIEIATKAPVKFRFPLFQTMHWFAATRLLQDLKDINSQGMRCPELFARGIRALLVCLKRWTIEEKQAKEVDELIPEKINVPKLLKELGKELRHAEKNSNLNMSSVTTTVMHPLQVPKLEKDSTKRIRRKPQARSDFVDINEALSNFAAEESRLEKFENIKNGSAAYEKNSSLAQQQQKVSLKTVGRKMKLHIPKRLSDDDSDDQLMIDERKSYKPAKVEAARGPIKLRLSVGSRTDLQITETTEVAANMDIEASDDLEPAHNGFSDILRASAFPKAQGYEDLKSGGRTSPSTREAIAGMLSMSSGFLSPSDQTAPLMPVLQQRQRKARRRLHSSLKDDYSDVVSKVHQDDEYIYPSLDASDDEDGGKRKPGRQGRSRLESGDESWNPRAKVGPVVRKTDRPVREGVKRPAVERVLEAAAQRRAIEPPPKRPYVRRIKSRPSIDGSQSEASSSNASKPSQPAFTSCSNPSPDNSASVKADNKVKKPKKGMATAKQRLGKILKIHKMQVH